MIRRLLILAALLTLPARAVAATLEGRDLGGGNLICGPGSAADDSIPCSPNDVLSGVFTNVGLFQVNAGTTVFVTPGVSLVVFASTISISGFLNGSGRGEVGGIGGDPGQPGGDGEGRGPGIGAYTNMGGGGGGYGGYGGDGSGTDGILGIGGNLYDDPALPVSAGSLSQGSGGGGGGGSGEQTGGSGGQGGASIYLEASFFTLTGSIFARGVPGGNSTKPADAGGGGAGGSLLLRCMDSAAVGGLINASGGKGGDAIAGGADVPYPGGGGGGGRVKIYYRQADFSVIISTDGGAKGKKSANGPEGIPNAQPGTIGAVSFATVASPPAGLSAPAVFVTSITWSWAAAPDWGDAAAASRQYRLYSGTVSYRSLDRSPQFAAASGALSADETGLTPNTTYTRYATAFTDHSDSLPSNLVSIHTRAGRPGAAAGTFTALAVYSLNLNWSAGEPANPGYTSYEVNRSTAIDFGAGAAVSYVAALSSGPAGLAPNTTYYFRVRAINLDGLPTEFTQIVSTATLAAAPGSPSFAGVNSTGFLFNWDGADNPPLTRYIAEISTDNFATLARSSITLDTETVFSGLAVNALYYARARAQNHNGMDTGFTATVTTVTATSPPVNAPAPFTNLSAGALTFNWGSGGNSAGTNYNPELSADSSFSTLISSEVTTNLNYIFTGLSVNATYYARVRALGAGGSASPYSSPAVSTVTLALPPVPAAAPFTQVLGGSFTFNWENGGNPAGTVYTAEISKDGFVSLTGSVQTSALNAPFASLTSNTVYQARVRAVNFAGVPGQYSSPIVSTATAVSAAANAPSPFQNLSANTLTFNWESGGNSSGTNYNPELSTSSNFSAPVSSAVTTSLNYLFTGLSVNTTYYAHVRAIGAAGSPTPYAETVSTVTYTLAPDVPASPFSGVSIAGFTLGWNTGGNPPNTRYAAEISRDSFVTIIASASTLATSAAFSGLAPNTIYQVRAKALNFLGVEGPYSSPIRSTATLAAAPLNQEQPFTAVSASTFTFTWGDGGNPGGTSYAAEISSAAFAPGTAVSSAATLALSQTFGGLLANTTYHARVKAVNMNNIPSAYAAAVTAVTLPLAPAPASPPFSGVTSSGLTLNWTAGGNPPDTTYVAEISKDGFVSVAGSVQTSALNAPFAALTSNTVYQARVHAVNFAGVPGQYSSPIVSTATAVSAAANAPSPFQNLSANTLTFNWESGGNSAGTSYNPELSTSSDFSAPVSSAVTTDLNYLFTGLSVNTTYYAHVRAIGVGGNPTPYTGTVSTVTYTLAPDVPASPFSGVSIAGFTLGWTAGGNPPDTRYAAEISRDSFITIIASASTLSASAAFAGLAPNTIYQVRAKALNFLGVEGPYSSPIRSTATLAAPPINEEQPFTAISASTFTFNWAAGGNPGGTSYNIEVSSSGFAPGTAVSSAAALALSQTFSGLLANTTYHARVKAVNMNNIPSAYAAAVTAVTLPLAPAPASPPFSGVTSSGLTLNWTAGGNPPDTTYVAEISKDGFVSVAGSAQTSALGASFSALAANTVYQARVWAVNFAGITGQYSSAIVSTATASSAPLNAALPFQNLSANTLTFNWDPDGNSAGTSYNPEISTSSDFSAPVSSAVTINLNYLFTGLSANATYYAHVRAIGVGGNSTSYTGAVSTVTWTLAPEVSASPFSGVSVSNITLGWAAGGNPPNTRYAAEISRDSFATIIASASTLATSAAFSGLAPNTIYQVRAKALNFLGVEGPYSSPIRSTATLAAPPINEEQPFTAISASTFTFNWAAGGNPGGTSYAAELSSAAFAPGTAISSAATLALSQTFSGLLANTTYHARVKAVNMNNIPSAYAAAVTAVTLPLAPAPASPPFSGVTSSGLTLNWTAGGNPPDTTYVAEISKDGFVSLTGSVQTSALNAPFAALTSNTVYQARIRAVNFAGVPGQYSSPIVSTPTAISPAVNAPAPFQNLSANTLTFNWESGGNSAGTNYNPELSTSSDFSAPVSSAVTTSLNYLFTGLSVNTTYYAHVRAIGVGGNPTPYAGTVSTVTYTLAPDVPASPFSGVSIAGFTLSWNTGGNPPNTRYAAEISRDGFVSVSSAVRTSGLSAVFSALAANTVYQARVWAVNFAGITGQYSSAIVSTATASSAPLNTSMPFQNLSANTLTFNWDPDGNSAGTSYNPELSTSSDFSAPVSSAVTINLNYLFTGLSANATYYARVRALGTGGSASTYSSPAVSTVTLTLPPVPAAMAFTAVLGGSFTFNWENGGNPAGTVYTAEISRDGFVSVSGSAQTSALGAGFSALAANTVYQARVRAVNFAGIPGQYSSPIVSTATAISAPGTAAVAFQNLSPAGLTFAWGDGGNAQGTNYNPEISTSSDFSAPVSSGVTPGLNYVFTGLAVNATYYAHVRAIGVGGNPSSYTGAVSTVTWALAPALPATPFTGVSMTAVVFNWGTGGNPGSTRYTAELSRNNFATPPASSSTLATSALFSGLTPNTIYQVRAKALNFLGVESPYSAPIRSTTTLAASPLNAEQPFTAVSAGTFTFTWGDGGNPGGTSYAVEISSAAFAPGTAVSSAATLALSQTFSGLLANTTYYARVKAVNMDNVPSGYAAAVTAVTLPLSPALAAPPFSAVSSSGLTLGWTANGNPQGTTYVAELSRDNFITISLSATTQNTPAVFTDLAPNTTYTARIRAVNFAGDYGPYSSPFVSTATLAVPPESAAPSLILTDSGLTALWLAGGNPPGTRYEAEVSTRPGFETLWASASVSGLSETFALAANTTYYARVRARNYNGIPTQLLAVGGGLTTYAALPAVSASSAPGPVSVTTFSFTNTVSTGTGGLLFYRTAWNRNATHAWNDQESVWAATGVLTTTATGNGYWYLHLRSYNFDGLGYKAADIGPFHVALSTVMPPGQPVPVPGAFTATSGITWNWPPAIAFGDTIISTYVVSVGTTPFDFNVLADFAIGPLASFTLDPAANGRIYYLKVRAVDEGGILSQYSPVSSPGVLVDRSAPERPGAVRADRKFSYDSNLLFSWAPSADGESGIKGYLLDVGTSLYGKDIYNAKDLGQELSYQATGLPGGKSVYARVRAENNAGGFSDYSELAAGVPVLPLGQTPPMTEPYNWPNPFDPAGGPTQIGFFLKAPARVTLKLFTLEGNLVYEETRAEGAGGNKVWPWGGRNGAGRLTAPGGYICLIEKRYPGKTERQQFKLAVLY